MRIDTPKDTPTHLLKNADKYNNFALNSNGSSCQWKETKTCTVPDTCKVA